MMARARQRGFGLVISLFLIVVLASASAMMVSLSGWQQSTNLLALQSARASYAADSGVEWGLARASADPSLCPVAGTALLGTLAFSQPGLNGFISEVRCSRTGHVVGASTINMIRIEAVGKFAVAGDALDFSRPDYVAAAASSLLPVEE